MAKVSINAITSHFRGKIGDVVFKWYGDKLVATRVPTFRKKKKLSEAEKAKRAKFAKANAYARGVLADPKRRAEYAPWAQLRRRSIQVTAISDYLTDPKICLLDPKAYQGRAGNPIFVRTDISGKVVTVAVKLRHAGGKPIEQGVAVGGYTEWMYRGAQDIAGSRTIEIEVTATDRTGKSTTMKESVRIA